LEEESTTWRVEKVEMKGRVKRIECWDEEHKRNEAWNETRG
jgi:hypothetical protein